MKTRFLALVFFLLSTLGFAQVDIPITSIGPIRDIARNVTWAGSGTSAINNSYLVTPVNPFETACLYITNNDVSSHSISVAAFGTGDQGVSRFQGNTAAWNSIGPLTGSINSSLITNVPAGATRNWGVLIQSAAKVTFLFSAGSGAGTTTVTLVESPTLLGCANFPSPFLPLTCNQSTFALSVASGTTAQMVPPQANQAAYVCNFTYSAAAALAAGNIAITSGTGATCATGTITDFELLTAATTPIDGTFTGAPLIPRFPNGGDTVGDALCVTNNQATTVAVFINYAQF